MPTRTDVEQARRTADADRRALEQLGGWAEDNGDRMSASICLAAVALCSELRAATVALTVALRHDHA